MTEPNTPADLVLREARRWSRGEIGNEEFRGYVEGILERQSPPEGGDGLDVQKEPRERCPCKPSDCATSQPEEECPYVGYCNEEGLCENWCEIRQRINAAAAQDPCTHCGESEPWVGLCDRMGDLCGKAAAREHTSGAQEDAHPRTGALPTHGVQQ